MTVKEFFESGIDAEIYKNVMDLAKDLPYPEAIKGKRLLPPNEMLYGHMVELRRRLGDGSDYDVALAVGEVLLDEDVSQWPYIDYLPYMLSVSDYVVKSVENENKRLEYKPTSDEIKAGIKKLQQFGEWGVVDSIAQRMHILHEQVLKLRYEDVFMMQWRDMEESRFQRKLIEIKNPKS